MRFFICTTAGGDPKGEPYVLNASEWVESHLISRGQAKDMGVLDGGKVIMQVAWGALGQARGDVEQNQRTSKPG